MTDASSHCAACNWPLGPDDLYCSRCATPTSRNIDLEATVINPGNARGSAAAAPVPLSGPAFNDRLRQVLGAEYELLSVIGQGGFARVYRAKDRRLDRVVAIKVIRPDLIGTQGFLESFQNEGIALAKLRHPGIVPIYDIRERGGLIYYVMPFVQGTTLEARMHRARLPPFETRRILSELADALAAAHRVHMAHLDIKPANVFLEGDQQKVLLMDFGIARALTKQTGESPVPVVGTPEYMSPEQARGQPDIDQRSDIYSLGVLGYRMLVGRLPFRGRDAADVLAKQVNEAPVPVRDINPSIPKDFADAIMRCLKKEPGDRFATALDLRKTLESVAFFSTSEEAAGREAGSGIHSPLVILIAGVAFLAGLLLARYIG